MKFGTKWLQACLVMFVAFTIPMQLSAQRKVTFLASDRLEVTADLYLYDNGAPYIILFHQENGSRGEYREIAPKLLKLGFNCLAVDLRSGKESNFVKNETAAMAQTKNLPSTTLDCEKDILAAIEYVGKTAIKNRYILFGSSFSASLAMKVANRNQKATAVIAFSPGEYFNPVKVKDWLKDFDKLLYVTSTKREQPFVTELIRDIPAQYVTKYQPSGGGIHGAPALQNDNPSASDGWMSLMMFVKKVKEGKYK
jgi:pimeloyl-ACP methyl ester carboxylesterase